MPIRDLLERVLTKYRTATAEPFANHEMAIFLRGPAAEIVSRGLGEAGEGLQVDGSAGAGNWAVVPWIAAFDPAVTTSATRGYYVVYLFHATEPIVHLSLNQGTTAVREEFGGLARQALTDRAELMRKRLADFVPSLAVTKIDLGSTARLPGDYAAGHALGVTYRLSELPTEEALITDLQNAVTAYRALTFRGGLDATPENDGDVQEQFAVPPDAPLIEIRRYKLHRRIERNSAATRAAKKFHGTRCQACELDFVERYGPIGEGFIEAHHLRPISKLEEGVPVKYDLAVDFAVLCSNCHRMIHRSSDPSDLAAFRKLVR